jgi:hypothetical protein
LPPLDPYWPEDDPLCDCWPLDPIDPCFDALPLCDCWRDDDGELPYWSPGTDCDCWVERDVPLLPLACCGELPD